MALWSHKLVSIDNINYLPQNWSKKRAHIFNFSTQILLGFIHQKLRWPRQPFPRRKEAASNRTVSAYGQGQMAAQPPGDFLKPEPATFFFEQRKRLQIGAPDTTTTTASSIQDRQECIGTPTFLLANVVRGRDPQLSWLAFKIQAEPQVITHAMLNNPWDVLPSHERCFAMLVLHFLQTERALQKSGVPFNHNFKSTCPFKNFDNAHFF